jgi:ribosomal protein S18 acetylase RimI-like enzyme
VIKPENGGGSGHGLGPHVVGQRVVVRQIVPGETGPSGGPALTDTLGVCESWADGVAVIRKADGNAVQIPTALIVSGKPVPPRPSVRGRVSVREAESHAGPLWTGVVREALGDWELRTEPDPVGRRRKRINSCLAIGDPGADLAAAEAAVLAFYAERDRPPIVQVEADADLERRFTELGWTAIEGEAHFLLGSVARVRRTLGDAEAAVELVSEGPRLTATTPSGRGEAGLDGDWLGVHGVYVEPPQRRQGVATHLLRALVEGGAERGATTVWLHVETDNAPALALYEGLGFVEHHTCRYLIKSAPPHQVHRGL